MTLPSPMFLPTPYVVYVLLKQDVKAEMPEWYKDILIAFCGNLVSYFFIFSLIKYYCRNRERMVYIYRRCQRQRRNMVFSTVKERRENKKNRLYHSSYKTLCISVQASVVSCAESSLMGCSVIFSSLTAIFLINTSPQNEGSGDFS